MINDRCCAVKRSLYLVERAGPVRKFRKRRRNYRKTTAQLALVVRHGGAANVVWRRERAPGRKARDVSPACSACGRARREMFAKVRPTRALNLLGRGARKRESNDGYGRAPPRAQKCSKTRARNQVIQKVIRQACAASGNDACARTRARG